MKVLPISNEKSVKLDDEDYEELSKWKWSFKNGYAVRRNGHGPQILMHRQIMNFPNQMIDHIDRDGLNNQRSNLRLTTDAMNQINTGPHNRQKPRYSKYKGVSFQKANNKWVARLSINGRNTYLGYFEREEDAAIAYNAAMEKHYPGIGHRNMIGGSQS